ncbi:MAG: hypothetical protein NHB32_12920 [Fischerella sp. CENA71]|nr:hypothetical protein [Fischerella sp. CENA71]
MRLSLINLTPTCSIENSGLYMASNGKICHNLPRVEVAMPVKNMNISVSDRRLSVI